MNPCTKPVIPADVDGDGRWRSMHQRFISDCREKDPEIIFLGDDILDNLNDTDTWNQYFAPLHSLNFSIRMDKVENILWRVENGELDNVKPKIVVLHAGTNNGKDNSAEEIAEGIIEIVNRIREKLPDAYIVLPAILPRGQHPNNLREKFSNVNSIIRERVVGMNRIQTLNIDKDLIQADGTISHFDMFDYKNLTNTGAKKVFEPVHDLLTQILNENEKEIDLTPSE